MTYNFKILAVDDEETILDLLEYNLSKEGYTVETASNGEKAVEIAKTFKPNLILMDVMMPVMDGIEACRNIREIPELKNVMVLFLTARSEEYTEIAAFESGADDYITKPIKPRSLLSRISAVLRRTGNETPENEEISIRDLIIDKESYTVKKGDHVLPMPKKEFELLYFLAKHPDKVYNREELLKNIWGTDVYVVERTVDVHIRKIREKVGGDYITTIKGVGYKFVE